MDREKVMELFPPRPAFTAPAELQKWLDSEIDVPEEYGPIIKLPAWQAACALAILNNGWFVASWGAIRSGGGLGPLRERGLDQARALVLLQLVSLLQGAYMCGYKVLDELMAVAMIVRAKHEELYPRMPPAVAPAAAPKTPTGDSTA